MGRFRCPSGLQPRPPLLAHRLTSPCSPLTRLRCASLLEKLNLLVPTITLLLLLLLLQKTVISTSPNTYISASYYCRLLDLVKTP
jgi:hypothetical protein